MITWLKIWTPIGLLLVYLFLAESNATLGEFARIGQTALCLPGVIAIGSIPFAIYYYILKKLGKIEPDMRKGGDSGGGIVEVARR